MSHHTESENQDDLVFCTPLYLQYIQHLLGDTEGMLQPNKIVSLAQDCSAWRNPVVACSQPKDDDDADLFVFVNASPFLPK